MWMLYADRERQDIETVDMSLSGTLQQVNSSLASFAASAITIMCATSSNCLSAKLTSS